MKLRKFLQVILATTLVFGVIISPSFTNAKAIIYTTETYWKITSKKKTGTSTGAWRNGPSGKGPSALNINQSTTKDISVTNSISGSYPVGKGTIGSSLGITIGTSKTYGTSYTVTVPKGKKYLIIYRPVYNVYTVKQQKYYRTGSITQASGTYSTATVKSFNHWDYSWKSI
ncbi:hypothetical protein [Listeria booriae]|uniref:hypothetical protein n=1 Tax=Listeria booriae TaxID=1552123 RepID=UPI0016255C5C|nr:hypothetical protein [Listeria booriae]MBC1210599.1 hypothetical protein [Listeria booriae]MBC1234147.1 hypothetical protein [Listeria booriae]MBC1247512.1 hypothetical protein [Listeria booriae]